MKDYNASDIHVEKASCKICSFNIKRADMKNVKYCVKRNFPILNDGESCTKFVRRNKL